jgi:hypothetical protein
MNSTVSFRQWLRAIRRVLYSRERLFASWVFCPFALTASANSIRRRIASEREGLSFCRLAQL